MNFTIAANAAASALYIHAQLHNNSLYTRFEMHIQS